MADILADFNPVESEKILNHSSHKEIVERFRTYQVFNSIDKDGSNG